MELNVNDVTTANPSADAISRAVDAVPSPGERYLCLDSQDGTVIDADVRPDGMFDVSAVDRGRALVARSPLAGAELKGILLRMRAGDRSWTAAPFWDELPPAAPPPRMSRPPAWALALLVGSIVVVGLTVLLLQGRSSTWRESLPYGDSDFFWVIMVALPFVALVAVAVLVKLLEIRRAAAWPSAMGRIVRSANEEQRHTNEADQVTVTRVAAVEYEFTVARRTWRGNRVSLGEAPNTDATLARYPVGTIVEVFYDPANPANSVLERDPWAGRNA